MVFVQSPLHRFVFFCFNERFGFHLVKAHCFDQSILQGSRERLRGFGEDVGIGRIKFLGFPTLRVRHSQDAPYELLGVFGGLNVLQSAENVGKGAVPAFF